jgi:hypothetical protein
MLLSEFPEPLGCYVGAIGPDDGSQFRVHTGLSEHGGVAQRCEYSTTGPQLAEVSDAAESVGESYAQPPVPED